jgi:hypothetical protein
MPKTTPPAPATEDKPAQPETPKAALIELDEPAAPVDAEKSADNQPLTPASEPLIQQEALPEPATDTAVSETTDLRPATEPLAGPYQPTEEDKPEPETAPAAVKPASEPLAAPMAAIAPEKVETKSPKPASKEITVTSAVKGQTGIKLPTVQSQSEDETEQTPPSLPRPIYGLIAANLVGFVASWVVLAKAPGLLLSLGLGLMVVASILQVLRRDVYRRIAIGVASLMAVYAVGIGIVWLITLNGIIHNVQTYEQSTQMTISQLDLNEATRRDFVAELKALERQRDADRKILVPAAVYAAAVAVLLAGQAVYLRRAKVREAFHKTPS